MSLLNVKTITYIDQISSFYAKYSYIFRSPNCTIEGKANLYLRIGHWKILSANETLLLSGGKIYQSLFRHLDELKLKAS